MAARRDELFVSTGSGLLQRVNWNGLLEGEMTMSIHSIPFTNDLENARGELTCLCFFNHLLRDKQERIILLFSELTKFP